MAGLDGSGPLAGGPVTRITHCWARFAVPQFLVRAGRVSETGSWRSGQAAGRSAAGWAGQPFGTWSGVEGPAAGVWCIQRVGLVAASRQMDRPHRPHRPRLRPRDRVAHGLRHHRQPRAGRGERLAVPCRPIRLSIRIAQATEVPQGPHPHWPEPSCGRASGRIRGLRERVAAELGIDLVELDVRAGDVYGLMVQGLAAPGDRGSRGQPPRTPPPPT